MSTSNKRPIALIGENPYEYIKNGLLENGFEVVLLPRDNRLAPQVSSHADMLIFTLENTVFCNKAYYENNRSVFERIEEYGYKIDASEFTVSNEYPNDIALNQATIEKNIIGRKDSCAESILKHAKLFGYAYKNIKQGYAKCSTLVLNENAIITADKNIVSAAKALGRDSLLIKNGIDEIKLKGYDYGFIGGASTVYNNNVFFFGNLMLHSQFKEISEFCQKHGFSTISLGKEALCDIGGAIMLPDISKK